MKTLNRTIISAIFLILIYSCKKNEANTPAILVGNNSNNAYSQLGVGNYWIYQQFELDEKGNSTPLNKYDSCYILSDTSIRGKTFFKMYRPSNSTDSRYTFLSDSLHYLVDNYGTILFSSGNFTKPLHTTYLVTNTVSSHNDPNPIPDTVSSVLRIMDDINAICVTPSGSFRTINSKEIFSFFPNFVINGRAKRYKSTKYSYGIGIVSETLPFYLSSPNYIERRLVRYSVK